VCLGSRSVFFFSIDLLAGLSIYVCWDDNASFTDGRTDGRTSRRTYAWVFIRMMAGPVGAFQCKEASKQTIIHFISSLRITFRLFPSGFFFFCLGIPFSARVAHEGGGGASVLMHVIISMLCCLNVCFV
jgi:hypothetical protein